MLQQSDCLISLFDDVKSITNLILNDTKEYRLKNTKCSFAKVFLLPKIFYCSDLMAKVCFHGRSKEKQRPAKWILTHGTSSGVYVLVYW